MPRKKTIGNLNITFSVLRHTKKGKIYLKHYLYLFIINLGRLVESVKFAEHPSAKYI